jgi:hypothetical protein
LRIFEQGIGDYMFPEQRAVFLLKRYGKKNIVSQKKKWRDLGNDHGAIQGVAATKNPKHLGTGMPGPEKRSVSQRGYNKMCRDIPVYLQSYLPAKPTLF